MGEDEQKDFSEAKKISTITAWLFNDVKCLMFVDYRCPFFFFLKKKHKMFAISNAVINV